MPENENPDTSLEPIAASEIADSHFQHHIFFCLNKRDPQDPRGDCCKHGAESAFEHTKIQVKTLGLSGKGKVRVNQAGCLDRCEYGPVCVVYPEAVWYQYLDHTDLDEIISEHLQHGRIVDRLKIDIG